MTPKVAFLRLQCAVENRGFAFSRYLFCSLTSTEELTTFGSKRRNKYCCFAFFLSLPRVGIEEVFHLGSIQIGIRLHGADSKHHFDLEVINNHGFKTSSGLLGPFQRSPSSNSFPPPQSDSQTTAISFHTQNNVQPQTQSRLLPARRLLRRQKAQTKRQHHVLLWCSQTRTFLHHRWHHNPQPKSTQ